MTKKNMTLKQAFDFVKSKRKIICPTTGFIQGLIDLDYQLYGKYSMTLEEYSIFSINEIMPSLSKEEILKVYQEIKNQYKNKEKYEKEMIEKKIEPIGYKTYDKLRSKYGKSKCITRYGCPLHQPFE